MTLRHYYGEVQELVQVRNSYRRSIELTSSSLLPVKDNDNDAALCRLKEGLADVERKMNALLETDVKDLD